MAALLALCLKLAIAFNTFGTNDVVSFYQFGQALTQHDLGWLYRHSIYFNHPPLVAYYLRAIYQLSHQAFFADHGISFPFLLRAPGIFADFVVVLALWWTAKEDRRIPIPAWALLLFALSPVSLMVSGFHGNTDSVMVMFLVVSSLFCLRNQPAPSGFFLALSCQIKIVPLLLLPIFLFFWWDRRRLLAFVIAFSLPTLALWAAPLLHFPGVFITNVLSYGSLWGLWGITYWLRLTQIKQFGEVVFYDFPPAEMAVNIVLKLVIVGCVLVLAWRRRHLEGRGVLDSIAYAWVIFFVFSPGIAAQYLVWLAPFVLVLSPVFYGWLVATSTLFLFFFYNVNSGEWPWYAANANASPELNKLWTPWALWPWATLLIAMVVLWKRAKQADASLRLISFERVRDG